MKKQTKLCCFIQRQKLRFTETQSPSKDVCDFRHSSGVFGCTFILLRDHFRNIFVHHIDALLCFFFFAYIICKFRRSKKSSMIPRTKPACCFSFHWFFRLFKSCAQAYISLCVPSSQILPASLQARQICHVFSKNILPFVGWLQAARFPYSDALHIFPQNIHRYFMFFACKTHSPPGRSRLASLSTNIIC